MIPPQVHQRFTRQSRLAQTRSLVLCVFAFASLVACRPATAAPGAPVGQAHASAQAVQKTSIADHRITWPTRAEVLRVVTLRDYNTRVVLLGTTLLGAVAGIVGTFMLLRKRALMGDVLAHSALPGVAVAFIAAEMVAPGSGRSLSRLLIGALVAGLLGISTVLVIGKFTRLKEDAALAITLSAFFGLGIALFTVIQNIPAGNVAGLQGFIFGKTASTVAADVRLISQVALVVLVVCVMLFKEFSLLSFDEGFAAAEGWPVVLLDVVLMGLVAVVTVIGMQSVGLLLVVAILIIPAVSARFWTNDLRWMVLTAAMIGGASALLGVMASALFPRLAAGAVIVLVGSALFLASMLFGPCRGVLRRASVQWQLKRRAGRQHLLRALYECVETAVADKAGGHEAEVIGLGVSFDALLVKRTWSPHRLRRLIADARRHDLLTVQSDGTYALTAAGLVEARRVARNHRMWELYLIAHADVAASRVDRFADLIEHVLEPDILEELESRLAEEYPHMARMPASPHELQRPEAVPG